MLTATTSLPPSPSAARKQEQLVTARRRATAMLAAVTAVFIATVVAGDPLPSATGVPQTLPSIETCTR